MTENYRLARRVTAVAMLDLLLPLVGVRRRNPLAAPNVDLVVARLKRRPFIAIASETRIPLAR